MHITEANLPWLESEVARLSSDRRDQVERGPNFKESLSARSKLQFIVLCSICLVCLLTALTV